MISSCWGLDTSSSIKFSFNCYIVCLWTYFRWDISYKLGPSSDEYSPRCNCGLGKLKFTPFQKNRGRGSRKNMLLQFWTKYRKPTKYHFFQVRLQPCLWSRVWAVK